MFLAEALGGLNSVVITDSIQSTIMIAALVCMTVLGFYHYGLPTNNIGPHCSNEVVLNCTVGTKLFERGAACAGKIVENGCWMANDGKPYMMLHPAVGMSDYFKAIWSTPDGKSWPEYPCTDAAGNLTGSMCENPAPGSEVMNRGWDTLYAQSYKPLWMWQLALGFVAQGLYPNFTIRCYAGKSDASVKQAAILQVILGGLIATLPMVLLGVVIGSNLVNIYPPGSSAYGMLVSDFNNRGGFTQAVGVSAGVAAIAAMMSTADSCCISITTMLSTEFLRNGLFKAKPEFNKPIVVQAFAICCSFVVISVACATALYDDDINNPAATAYSDLGIWQITFFIFGSTPLMCGLFCPHASDWAVLAGMLSFFLVFLPLQNGPGNNVGTDYFTPFADEPKTIALRSYLWAWFAQVLVTVPLCCVPLGRWFPTPAILRLDTEQHDPEGKRLDKGKIDEAMRGTREIVKDPVGAVLVVAVLVLLQFAFPWFGESYDGCDLMSYIVWYAQGANPDEPHEGCAGTPLCGGIPCWIVPAFVIFPINKVLIVAALSRWRPAEDASDTPIEAHI